MSSVIRERLTKHIACDRCRKQKVRCLRGELNVHACARCQHAGVQCTTSEPKPRGRPPTTFRTKQRIEAAATQPHFESAVSNTNEHYGHPFGRSPPAISSTSLWLGSDIDLDTYLDQDFSGFPGNQETRELTQTSTADYHEFLPPQGRVESATRSLALPIMTNNTSELQTNTTSVQPQSRDLVTSDIHSNSWNTLTNSLLSLPLEARVEDSQTRHQSNDHCSTQSTLVRLARVNEDISRHFDIIGVHTPDMASLQSVCSNLLQQSTVHPLTAILNTTSNFLSLIRLVSSSSCSNSGSDPGERMTSNSDLFGSALPLEAEISQSTSASESSSMHKATIMMMVAGRLQLIRLYDVIFRRAYQFLSAFPYDQTCLYHALAGLNFGDFATDAHLRMKIVVQIVEHYLEQIERLIDLRSEYGLYDQHHLFQGVLHQWAPSILLRAFSTQTSENLDDLTSLKWHLQGVKNVLQV